MRKIMMAMAALALSSGVAWGQTTASQSVTLTAAVGSYCKINGTTGVTPLGIVGLPDSLIVNQLVPIGGALTIIGAGASGTVACTSSATVLLESANGGLTNTTGAGNLAANNNAGTFTNKIHYTATASYGSRTETLDTGSGAGPITPITVGGSVVAGGAQTTGTLVFGVSIKPNTSQTLVGGNYADSLRVTLAPVN